MNPTTSSDTICAISTAPGAGGIAVIRVSGKEAIAICNQIYQGKGKPLTQLQPYTMGYGSIMTEENTPLDDVVVALFKAPNSFTGEDTIEISCHGSLYIQQRIVQLLIQHGCRAAQAGEFTQRSFLNGKMDLSQAEAVADLIAASSSASHKIALNQMRGSFSNELAQLRAQLLDFASLVELELDFSEEEVEFANREQLHTLSNNIREIISSLANSFSLGNAIKNGIPTTIIGETNAGKSTLLNSLLHDERAIVSDIHGTTRDVIEDTINLHGTTFRFIDTAGIRDTNDQIENLGIELTFKKLDQATIVIWVVDATTPNETIQQMATRIAPHCKEKQLIILFNKNDQLTPDQKASKQELLQQLPPHHTALFFSAKNDNIATLENHLISAAQLPQTSSNDVIVTNIRHYEALTHAQEAILRVCDGLTMGISGDFLAQDIRTCMHYLGEITGEITTDSILHNIFAKFCIGK